MQAITTEAPTASCLVLPPVGTRFRIVKKGGNIRTKRVWLDGCKARQKKAMIETMAGAAKYFLHGSKRTCHSTNHGMCMKDVSKYLPTYIGRYFQGCPGGYGVPTVELCKQVPTSAPLQMAFWTAWLQPDMQEQGTLHPRSQSQLAAKSTVCSATGVPAHLL